MCSLKTYLTPIFASLLSISVAVSLYAQDVSPTSTVITDTVDATDEIDETDATDTMDISSTPVPSPSPTSLPPEPAFTACDSIAAEDLTTAITAVLNKLSSEGLQRPNCAILKAAVHPDLSPVINSLPENTTILLVPDSTPEAMPLNARSVMDLKNGQHMIGVSGDDSDVLLITPVDFDGRHMVGIGTANSFNNGEQETSVISGIHFKPFKDDQRDSVDSIIFAQCYNRLLIVDSNTFTLDRRASVFLDCKRSNIGVTPPPALLTPTEQITSDLRGGPGLQFINNNVIGDDEHSNNAPGEGLFVYGPGVFNLPEALQARIEGNHFSQSMKVAIEVETGSNATIHNNIINETLLTETVRNFIGIQLIGVGNIDPLPIYDVSKNTIGLDGNCVQLKRELVFSFSENQMNCNSPWSQTDISKPAHVIEEAPGEACATCNAWTPKSNGFVSPCFGLNSLDGDIHFRGFTCLSPQPPTPAPAPAPASSPTTNASATGSGSRISQNLPVFIFISVITFLATFI